MAPFTIDATAPTLLLLEEIVHSLARLEAHPLGANLASPFLAIYSDDWRQMALAEFEQLIAAFRADALIEMADDNLDDFVDEFDKTLLRKTKSDRSDPLYQYYFKPKRPSELKRPILGDQFEQMQKWVEPLKTSNDSELAGFGARLEGLIQNGELALKRQREASETIKTFRTLGARKALIDKLNALRKSTEGKLAELPHTHPEMRLPLNFASRFFKHAPKRAKTPAKEITSAALADEIKEAKAALAALEAQYQEALTKEETEAAKAAQLEADKRELITLEKEAAEAAKKVATLREKLGNQ